MEERLIRVEEGLKSVSGDLFEIKEALKDIAVSLKTLAVLEERHNAVTDAIKRAFRLIRKNGERIESVEKALPNLVMASGGGFKAVIYVMAALGLGAMGTILSGVLKY